MLQQLAASEQRLVSLTEELASRDLDTLRREMEDEEVSTCSLTPSLILLMCVHSSDTLWKAVSLEM